MTDRLQDLALRALLTLGWIAVVAAPFVEHFAISTGRFVAVAAVLALVQAAMLVTMSLRQSQLWQRCLGILAAAVLLGLMVQRIAGAGLAGKAGLIATSGVSHALIYGSLLLVFGQTLRPGHTALITGVATRVRGKLSPSMLAYTRTVTKAWCAFFLGQILLSALLLALAPGEVWSLFVNVLDGPMVVGMFAVEYGIRRWRFRHETHESPAATLRAFARSRADG